MIRVVSGPGVVHRPQNETRVFHSLDAADAPQWKLEHRHPLGRVEELVGEHGPVGVLPGVVPCEGRMGGEHEISFEGCLDNQDVIIGRGRLAFEGSGGVFLWLERVGDRIHALCNADGVAWPTVGHVEFPIDAPHTDRSARHRQHRSHDLSRRLSRIRDPL
jgi:hypothetical protein